MGTEVPLVFVIFDELPLVSLLDENQAIDAVRYPNFAELAARSHWYRNATTVSDSTLVSIPAILTGRYPQLHDARLPTLDDFPLNLFTLLEGSHQLSVSENATQLSPTTQNDQAAVNRMRSLFVDLAVVYGHLVLPVEMGSQLPPVAQSWKNFGTAELSLDSVGDPVPLETLADFTFDFSDRSQDFYAAVDSIGPDLPPRFFFVHSMLPHTPWTYLPSGKQYLPWEGANAKGAVDGKKWLKDQWLVTQAYQRHLLQVGFVDKLLGELLSRLKQIDAFDRSLIVVTADHGSSFRPDDLARGVSETNYADIMAIPLLIKAPFQTEGLLSDRNVETVDILPTVAAIMGIQVPWAIDGQSALGPETEQRLGKTVFRSLDREFTFDDILLPRQESLDRKLELFGSGPWRGVFAAGPHGELVGTRIGEHPVDEQTVDAVSIKGDVFYENVDLDSPFVFPNIAGRLWFGSDAGLPAQLAIGINGVIHATTQTSPISGDGSGFSALVPEASFRSGENRVEVFLVVEDEGGPRLKRLAQESHARYRVDTSSDGKRKTLVATDGESIPVHSTGGLGWVVGGTNLEESGTFIQGWAVDTEKSQAVRSILVFKNGELLYSDSPGLFEPIVTEILADSSPTMAGFYFELPASQFPDLEETKVEVFAVSNEKVAFEVNHPPNRGDAWPFASGIAHGGATPYQWGSIIHFGQTGTSSWFRTGGWSYAEDGFT
ncbi:MAG: sulfatase-like hydrolase/transferase, partial [Acidobacteriota bacterium]